MRVIAGEKGGRRLLAPPGHGTRPTSDRVREAAFSMLDSLGVLDGARVWDLFAGSGAMGIEALSRGAAHATFVEQAKGAVSATRANLAALGYGSSRATVVCGDVLSWVAQAADRGRRRTTVAPPAPAGAVPRGTVPPGAVPRGTVPPGAVPRGTTATVDEPVVDLVTADPPYAWEGWGALLDILAPIRPLVVAETGAELDLPDGWQALRSKRYGGTVVTLARRTQAMKNPTDEDPTGASRDASR
jgi:16S rRNA (guanine966-N2)-methyltransferase